MFHSHALHQQAESILRDSAPRLGEGYTFRGWNPICAVGRLAAESGFVPVAEPTSSMAGSETVRRVYGLTEQEVASIIAINDAGGTGRPERLAEALRGFCPVCTRLDAHRDRRVTEALRSE
jgi:hypothetical protein